MDWTVLKKKLLIVDANGRILKFSQEMSRSLAVFGVILTLCIGSGVVYTKPDLIDDIWNRVNIKIF